MPIVKKYGFVYLLTNKANRVLYIGVTSELRDRIWKHKSRFFEGSFTDKYNCDKLVWFEILSDISEAIEREKQLKAGGRKKKIALVNSSNPEWKDLWEEIQEL